MTKKQKTMVFRIVATFIIYIPLAVAEHMELLAAKGSLSWLALYLIPYLLIGWDIIYKALRNIRNGQVFDENFLMALATFGAFGVGEYSEAVAVMLFYQVGELFQSYAVNRSRQSISDLMDICPEYANIEEDGVLRQVDPDDVEVGDVIVVKAGERIPLDGKVVFGDSMVDTSALTGEPVPVREDIEAKKLIILRHGLALWDTLESCTITGASDASIKDVVPNDIAALLAKAPIEAVFCNGATAYRIYTKYLQPVSGIAAIKLPSTSPANAACRPEKLREVWAEALGPWISK